MRAIPWGVLGVVITACAAEPAPIEEARSTALSVGGLVRVAGEPGIESLDGDVAVVCPGGGAATDAVGDAGCDAAIVDGAGGLRRLGRGDVVSAVRVTAARIAVIGADRRLVMIDEDGGGERVLAARAADARSAGPGRVVFTELRGDADAIDPTTTGRIVVLDVARGTRRVVTEHPMDSAPFAVPGSDDVVFVSSRTGLASVWLAAPGREARQITNVGRARVEADFVPVPGRELAWVPGTRIAVFTARYGEPVLWALDVDTGAGAALAPGRLPRAIGGAVVAIGSDGEAIELAPHDVVETLAGRAP